MATITLNYDARNTVVQKLIDVLVSFSGVKVMAESKRSAHSKAKRCGLDEALDDIENGRVHTYKSAQDMLNTVLG